MYVVRAAYVPATSVRGSGFLVKVIGSPRRARFIPYDYSAWSPERAAVAAFLTDAGLTPNRVTYVGTENYAGHYVMQYTEA